MTYPAFFSKVATVTLYDPLADMLGAANGGLLTYGYADAVRLAGHSCPTVAGAYLMTLKALGRLYGEATPVRGALRIEFGAAQADGVVGVTAAVAGLLTGAAGEGGFKGLGGRFSRQNLLRFAVGHDAGIRFVRGDTGAGLAVSYRPDVVPASPELQTLMPRLLAGEADAEEKAEFGRLWQMRVKRILIDHCDDPELVVLTPQT
jgi:formylmethanofuran dehydrogenase subunit E